MDSQNVITYTDENPIPSDHHDGSIPFGMAVPFCRYPQPMANGYVNSGKNAYRCTGTDDVESNTSIVPEHQ